MLKRLRWMAMGIGVGGSESPVPVVPGLGFGFLRCAVAKGLPLMEAADDGARDERARVGERRRRRAVVPVPRVAGQGGETIEHELRPVAVDDRER